MDNWLGSILVWYETLKKFSKKKSSESQWCAQLFLYSSYIEILPIIQSTAYKSSGKNVVWVKSDSIF